MSRYLISCFLYKISRLRSSLSHKLLVNESINQWNYLISNWWIWIMICFWGLLGIYYEYCVIFLLYLVYCVGGGGGWKWIIYSCLVIIDLNIGTKFLFGGDRRCEFLISEGCVIKVIWWSLVQIPALFYISDLVWILFNTKYGAIFGIYSCHNSYPCDKSGVVVIITIIYLESLGALRLHTISE